MKVAELEKQLQAVSGDMEGGKKIIGLSNSFRKEQSYKDELEETRKALINVCQFVPSIWVVCQICFCSNIISKMFP